MKKYAKIFLCLLLAMIMLFSGCQSGGGSSESEGSTPEIDDNGIFEIGGNDIAKYTIVIAEDADEYTKDAADELKRYINKSVDYRPKIVYDTDTNAESDFEIIVGTTNRDTKETRERVASLTNDGIMMYASDGGKKLYLNSCSSVGVGYAVCRFLNEYLGVRFYEENEMHGTGYVVGTYVDVPEDLDYTHSSAFRYRRSDAMQWNDLMIHWMGVNAGRTDATSYYPAIATYEGVPHSWEYLYGDNYYPCLTSELVYQTALENLIAWVEENPNIKYFQVTMPDSTEYCNCKNCSRVRAAEGEAGLLLYFVNRLAEDVTAEYPDVYLQTFAYNDTIEPPKTIVPHDHVIIWFCPIDRCFSHAFNDPACEMNAKRCAQLERWAEISERFMVWDYAGNSWDNAMLPWPDIMSQYRTFKYYAELGAEGLMVQTPIHSQTRNSDDGNFWHLESYLLGEMLWNPTMTEEEYRELMIGFLKYHYGEGWEYIYEYINLADAKWQERCCTSCAYCMKEQGPIFQDKDDPTKWDIEFAAKIDELWNKAVNAAGDQRTKYNCEASKCASDYVQLLVAYEQTGSINREAARALLEKYYEIGGRCMGGAVHLTQDNLGMFLSISPALWLHP